MDEIMFTDENMDLNKVANRSFLDENKFQLKPLSGLPVDN